MNSPTRPFMRWVAIPLAAAVALGIPVVQALTSAGLTAGEFSYQGDSTLRVEGFAFSIWGLLYAGMFAYTVYQVLPGRANSQTFAAFAWPSVVAMAGCGAWLAAAAANWRWGTVFIIGVAATALIFAILRAPRNHTLGDYWFIVAPLSLLGGWLTIASVANLLTVVTMKQLIAPSQATAAALIGIVVAGVIAAFVAVRSGNAVYLLPVIWGLFGVYSAESARNLTAANGALIVLVLLALLAIFLLSSGWRRERALHRAAETR